jgi:hypothetical protein
MFSAISEQSVKLKTIIKVLDLQHKFQKDPTSALGFKKYSDIKDIFKEQQVLLKAA